jgi:predicted nucleic acid-binding protein
MVKQNASLDASFWINACNADLVWFLPDYFALFVCNAVAQEIRYPLDVLNIQATGPSLFVEWCESGTVTLQDPQEAVDWFQRGENAAIALAIERGYFLLMDDANPYHFARSKGLKVVGTADLTVFLYDQGRLSYDQAVTRVKELRSSEKQKRQAMIALETLARVRGDRDVTE